MTLRDKYGWPVERIKGRPITNAIRLLLHANLWHSVFWRCMAGHWHLRSKAICYQPLRERRPKVKGE